jgi:diaminopimelate decarboxylase
MTLNRQNGPAAGGSRPMPAWTETLDLRSIAAAHATPLYLHDPATLGRAFDAYAALVGPAGVRYPVKANPSPVVLEAIARRGGGADCASPTEVTAALLAGIPLARIHYNTPAPNQDFAVALLRRGATVVADSAAMLAALDSALSPADQAGRLYIRVNPGALPGYRVAAEHQRYTAHGDPRSQFGVPSEDLLHAASATRLPITGLHAHVGTMMDNIDAFVEALAFLHALADALAEGSGHRPTSINLGGGLGLPHDRTQVHPSIEALCDALRPRLRADMDYEVEPGNSLVGDSFALLTRVVAKKSTRGRTWGICEVGTDQLVKHTVAGWRHEIVGPAHAPLPTAGPDALAGPMCFAGDVLLAETDLTGINAGDPLLILNTGAYCESIASRFNGRLGLATAIVEGGRVVRVARGEEDPFFALEAAALRPIPAVGGPGSGEVPAGRLAALQSVYMQQEAQADSYEVLSARCDGEGVYTFQVEVDAPCGFLGVPLAVRIVGDASIRAVGLALGWDAKRTAVLARRFALRCDAPLPGQGRMRCRVAVSALAPSVWSPASLSGTVRFELGDSGEIVGTAQVSVPTGG